MTLAAYLAQTPSLGARVYWHSSSQIIGAVSLGDDCSVWCNAVLRGDVNRISIGRGSNFQDLAMGHVSHKTPDQPEGSPLLIGEYVTVGHAAVLHGCSIGDECLIGMGSIVLDDAVIPDRVMIGAGSLVPPGKLLVGGMLYVGRPVKAIRALTPEEIAHLRYSAEHYIKLKNDYLDSQS